MCRNPSAWALLKNKLIKKYKKVHGDNGDEKATNRVIMLIDRSLMKIKDDILTHWQASKKQKEVGRVKNRPKEVVLSWNRILGWPLVRVVYFFLFCTHI
jgi:hypothetical protein